MNRLNRLSVFIVVCLLFVLSVASAQQSTQQKEKEDERVLHLPSVELGTGLTSFNGDVGRNDPVTSLTKIRFASSFGVEERIGNYIGLSLNTLYGTLAASDRTPSLNRNFESSISQTNLNLVFHFDNGKLLKKSSPIAPYVSAGFGFLKFDPYGYLKGPGGSNYYYWSDGGIHDAPQSVNPNAPLVPIDYNYKTRLTDSANNYKRYTFAVPICAGFRMKLSPSMHMDMSVAYYFTFSGYIDNYRTGNTYDSYLYASVSLAYNFGWKAKEAGNYASAVDFIALEKLDSDSDGVKDDLDLCPGTPKGVAVDKNGCPLDDDKDGVPNYRDKEPNSMPGAIVDENGVNITEEMIAEVWQEYQSAVDRVPENLEYIPGVLPDEFKYADKNNDGYISYEEIITVISDLFDNDTEALAEKINRLIDYYFLQK